MKMCRHPINWFPVFFAIILTACSSGRKLSQYLEACQGVRSEHPDVDFEAANWQRWSPSRRGQVVSVVGTIDWINNRSTKTFTIGHKVFCNPQSDEKEKLKKLPTGSHVRIKGIVGESYPATPSNPAMMFLECCLVEEL